MTDKDYKDLIYSIVVPQNMPQEEQNVRYQPLIDFLQTETPSSLYRFRECSENNISAFDQDQLWFTPGSEMNDDFDALLFLDRNTIYSNLERSLISFGAEIPNSVSNSFADDIATSVQAQFKQMSESEINEFRKQLHCFLVNRLDAKCPELSTSFRVSSNWHVFQKLLTLLPCGGITLNLEQALPWRMISEIRITQIVHCAKRDFFARPQRQDHYSV